MRISDWSSDVCSSDLGTASRRARLAIPHRHHRPLRARPAYRRRPGTGRALVRPVAPDRPHLGHPQQHGDAAGAAVGSGRRDARDDPASYPDRLCMSDGSAALSSDAASVDVGTDADWQRLHPATLALSIVRLGPRTVNFLPSLAAIGIAGKWIYVLPALGVFLLFSLAARSEALTSELQSIVRNSDALF